MAMSSKWRHRIILLAKILLEETDPQHPLPMSQLINRLERLGVSAERKSISTDLRALKEQGCSVVYNRTKGGYYIEERTLTHEDLAFLLDAVAVYPYLTDDQRTSITKKLQGFANVHQRPRLDRPVAGIRWGKADAEVVQDAIGRIHAAMQAGKALSFILVDYNAQLQRVPRKDRQVVTPKALLWTGRKYQLLAWDHKLEDMAIYYPDRMEQVKVAGVNAAGPDINPDTWASAAFGTDISHREWVKLRCSEELAGEVVDVFGPSAEVQGVEGGFILTANVVLGPEFLAWMHIHQEDVDLLSPPFLAAKWKSKAWSRGVV